MKVYYENDAEKTDFNTYAKINLQPVDKIGLFADVQYRTVGYDFTGFDHDLSEIEQSVTYKFWNPKAGVTFSPTTNHTFYASYAVGNREPTRDDFTESSPTSRPKHETLHNIEVGYRTKGKLGAETSPHSYAAELNFFNMDYRNQLVLTGQINDVGAYTRTNIANSYRRGVELAGAVNITKYVTLQSNVAYSQNKLKNFSDFVDDYDTGEQEIITFAESDISFSPDWVTSSQLQVRPLKGLETAFIFRTVSRQFLDNTSNESRVIPAYQVGDVRIRYRLPLKKTLKEVEFALLANNIFSEKYAASGYTYSYIAGEQKTTENFYYPQATRNYLGQVSLRF
ncbi:MAG: TonB-dependent receptor [Flavobacterium sp.]|nr:MAG: TonB-dependent receptor [Flavobacterium sp.]